MPAKKKPVKKRNNSNAEGEMPLIINPRLNSAPIIEQVKKTTEGEKRSAMVNTAKIKVPVIKPNCTELVRLAKKLWSSAKFLMISGSMALPANQSEVQIRLRGWQAHQRAAHQGLE